VVDILDQLYTWLGVKHGVWRPSRRVKSWGSSTKTAVSQPAYSLFTASSS
jgi:hypothetical protein